MVSSKDDSVTNSSVSIYLMRLLAVLSIIYHRGLWKTANSHIFEFLAFVCLAIELASFSAISLCLFVYVYSISNLTCYGGHLENYLSKNVTIQDNNGWRQLVICSWFCQSNVNSIMPHGSSYWMLFAADWSELIVRLVLGSPGCPPLCLQLHCSSLSNQRTVAQRSSPAAMLSPGATDTSQASRSRVLCCRWQANQAKVTFLPNI